MNEAGNIPIHVFKPDPIYPLFLEKPMGYESEYKRILNKLFAVRVRDLVSLIGKNKPGKPLEITRDKLDEYIEKLKELVESAIGKELLNEELDTAKDHHK